VKRGIGKRGRAVDDRLGAADYARRALKKVFPDHWSFLLGELALYSFVILLLTGTFLTFFFRPSMTDVVYHGSYAKLAGVRSAASAVARGADVTRFPGCAAFPDEPAG
jgi:ubiquinol-cytochrome c reductase cytochrome b subunit